MNVHEYQAKQLLRQYGVPVAQGAPAFTADEAVRAAQALAWSRVGGEGADPCRRPRQGQVQGGDAGDKGGVRIAKSIDEVKTNAEQMLGKDAGDGPDGASRPRSSERLFIEDGCDIARELYLSALVDRATSRISFIASTEGGMDIEKVAHDTPDKIVTLSIDPASGYSPVPRTQESPPR